MSVFNNGNAEDFIDFPPFIGTIKDDADVLYSLLPGLSPIIWCLPLQYHSSSVASLDPETM